MRIIQMLPTFAFGDAIGNDTIALDKALKRAGYKTQIYAELIDPKIKDIKAIQAQDYKYKPGDIIFYHLSTGSDLNYKITEYPCKRIIMYHNITPPEFFASYNPVSEKGCAAGLRAAKYLAGKADLCIVDSEYNKQDLLNMGYKCPMEVLPILIPFDDYKQEPNKKILSKYKDDWTNIIFTGRVAPNKCPQDIIAAFAYYNKFIQPKSRLFLVGSNDISEIYSSQLETYTRKLGVQNVYFTGHIKFDEILAYYHIADVFLCLSEHEGFCVPLVESMFFQIPIIAYNSSAISDTLGGSGLLLGEKSPAVVAEAINLVVENDNLRTKLIEGGRKRLEAFAHDKIEKRFIQIIKAFVGES